MNANKPQTIVKWTGALLVTSQVMIGGCISNPVIAMEPPGTKMPQVVGRNLHFEEIRFPDALLGRPALLLIAFRRHQQADVDTWLHRLPELERGIPDVRVLELPVLSRGYTWMRSYIDGGMRRGIPDDQARARTVTVYANKKKFRQALDLGTEDRIYAVRLDTQARLLHTEEGPATDDKVSAMLAAH